MIVCIGGKNVNVNIVKKNNKNIYFRFDNDLNLVVAVNKRISNKEIEKIILTNEKALYNMYNKVKNKIDKDKEFWYLGNKYEVIYDSLEDDIIFCDGVVKCKSGVYLEKFLNKQVREIFSDEVNKLREIIKTPDFTLKYRKMKTRWGVCNYKNMTITLNTELIKYRKELLRYVIIHEMCHFYHHNHGKEFWEMVSRYYPNYKMARKELRD